MLESPFNKVASLQACIFIKKRLQHRRLSVNIAKFLRTPLYISVHLQTTASVFLKSKLQIM